MNKDQEFIKGVNLGGWLVIEKWMTPELFSGTLAVDEYGLSKNITKEQINKHRKNFIRAEDFKWIAKQGFTHIRLPIGYWIFGEEEPYNGGDKFVNFALTEAHKNGLKVLLDLHSHPESQNGKMHSGKEGAINWHTDSKNIEKSLAWLTSVCREYGKHPALYGIELINEPHESISIDILIDYYRKGLAIVREQCATGVATVVSDSFRPRKMVRALRRQNLQGIVIDMHFYQTHSLLDKLLGFSRNLRKVRKWGREIKHVQKYFPVIVGEWSGGLGINKKELSRSTKAEITQAYINSQLKEYQICNGWFYWSYKVITREQINPWSARQMIEKKILNVKK